MAKEYIISLDLGTTVEKCVIYDSGFNIIGESKKEINTYYPHPGAAEIKAQDFFILSCEIIKDCIQRSEIDPKEIAVISIDSLMGGILGIDKNYDPVTYYDTAMDSRGAEESGYILKGFGDQVLEKNGSYPIWGHKMLYWKKQEEWKDIYKFMHPSAFVAGKLAGLSGKEAFMDQTFLSFSAFSDLKSSDWSPELCDEIGMDINKLPRILKSTEIIGETTDNISEMTGLCAGIPVCAGCGDVTSVFIGAGILAKGQAIDISGTANILAAFNDSFLSHKNLSCIRSPIGDEYYSMISHVLGGRTHKWFIDELFRSGTDTGPIKQIDPYSYLDEKASRIPQGSDGLISIDDLQGRFFPPKPYYRGLFIGHTWSHTLAHFYRSVLESISYDYLLGKEIFEAIGADNRIKNIRATGSGSNSSLWMQIKSDVLDTPIEWLKRQDLGTLGTALIGAYAVGRIKDIKKKAVGLQEIVRKTVPEKESNKKYLKYYKIYKELVSGPIFDDIYLKISDTLKNK